jgi:uncharacterized membrane protein YeaQ/YmgE (transglycosylase-associated protein family)
MSSKAVYYLAAFIGSVIGSYIPRLWGAGFLSFSSVLFSAIGAIAGIVIVWKWTN